MIKHLIYGFGFLLVIFQLPSEIHAQYNQQTKKIPVHSNKLTIDTLCILKSTFEMKISGEKVDTTFYILNPVISSLTFNETKFREKYPKIDSV